MRSLLIFIVVIIIYYAVKSVIRSALKAYQEEGARKRVKGEDMLLCPQCNTYVVKDRVVTRRIRGSAHSFCSEACAKRYEETHRD